MKASLEQKNAIELALKRNNIVVNSVAGSGKSTFLLMLAQKLQEQKVNINEIKILVFNTQNAADLIAKFGMRWKQSICTLNSCGHTLLKSYLGKVIIDKYKYNKIAKDMGLHSYRIIDPKAPFKDKKSFHKLLNLVRANNLTSINAENLYNLHLKNPVDGIVDWEFTAKKIYEVLQIGAELAANNKVIDFGDQLWLPLLWNIFESINYTNLKYICLDEAQDTNKLQQAFIAKLSCPETIFIGVGDIKQSIYGFAGADTNSFSNLKALFKAEEKELSTCYRCPKSHIELVNKLFPEININATDNAIEGTMKVIGEGDLYSNELPEAIKPGDLILCRNKAPLIRLCIALLAKGINAGVVGETVAYELSNLVEDIYAMDRFKFVKFKQFVSEYLNFKKSIYKGEINEEELVERLEDKLLAILFIYETRPFKTLREFSDHIRVVLENNNPEIELCTIHKAKGLQADRVYILEPDRLPMVWQGQTEEQFQQELNLQYVALTRSKSELYFIGNANWIDIPSNSDSDDCTQTNTNVEVVSEVEDIPKPTCSKKEKLFQAIDSMNSQEQLELIQYIQQKQREKSILQIVESFKS